jgi:hypothetical protein
VYGCFSLRNGKKQTCTDGPEIKKRIITMEVKMLKVLLSTLLLVIFIHSGCSPITVRYDYDHEYDFGQYKTYCWPTEDQIDKYNTFVKNTLVYKRVQEAVDKVLVAKGFSRVGCNEADLCVVVHAGVKDRMQIYDNRGYYGWYRPWWGPYGGYTEVSYYEEGTLVIDLVDEKAKELTWRGSATGTVKDYKDSEDMQKDIDAAVKKILQHFPPVEK